MICIIDRGTTLTEKFTSTCYDLFFYLSDSGSVTDPEM